MNLTIGENVKSIKDVFYYSPLEEVHVMAKTPPTISMYTFNKNKMSAVLYVPKGCKQLYKDSKWSQYFKDIVEE